MLDNLLVQLASSVDTDIMPGEFDPANQILPQQPLHPCLFPSEFEPEEEFINEMIVHGRFIRLYTTFC